MTTTLPATFLEADAAFQARTWIARLQEEDGDELPPLHPMAGHAFVQDLLRFLARRDLFSLAEVCNWARAGWEDAHRVLCTLIAEANDRGERLSAPLAAYAMEIVDPDRPPPLRPSGPQKATNLVQDVSITLMVILLIEQHGLKPTRHPSRRNHPSARPSACSVVAKALTEAGLHRGGEGAIQKIWNRYRKRILNGWNGPAAVYARKKC